MENRFKPKMTKKQNLF